MRIPMSPVIKQAPRIRVLCSFKVVLPGQRTTNDVRSDPADPQETTMGHRPGVVRVPTFQVHETRR